MDIQTAQHIASSFALLDKERLEELLNCPDVHMSQSNFLALKSFFNNVQRRSPSVGELIFFDAFIDSISEAPEQYAATDVCTNDEHIAKTLADVMEKYAAAHPDYNFPCTVRQVLELGAESVNSRSDKRFSESEKRLFAANSDESAILKATLNGYSSEHCQNGICIGVKRDRPINKKELKPRKEYAVAIVYGDVDSFERLAKFAIELSKSCRIIHAVDADGKNIFDEILKTTQSISLNTDLLPLPAYDQDALLPYERMPKKIRAATEVLFTEAGFGKHAIAVFVKKRALKAICAVAQQHMLSVCTAITVTKDRRFRTIVDGYVASDLNPDIFKAARIAKNIKVRIPDQTYKNYEGCAIKIDKSGNALRPLEYVYSAKTLISDTDDAFNSAVAAVITPFISSACDGINAQNSELSLSICATLPFSDKDSVDASYATLLGLYRAVIELGIPVEDLSIASSGTKASVSTALRAYRFGEKAEFITKLSPEELIDSFWKDEILPDFEKIRAVINGKSYKD